MTLHIPVLYDHPQVADISIAMSPAKTAARDVRKLTLKKQSTVFINHKQKQHIPEDSKTIKNKIVSSCTQKNYM
jgi:hypothetical protein